MNPAEVITWISFVILFYSYLGYGMIVWLLTLVKTLFMKPYQSDGDSLLPITLIVTAYNEAAILPEKINNTRNLDYPASLVHIFFVTDGSVDHSHNLLKHLPGVQVLHKHEREGKYAAIKRAMTFVETPIVVFSDSNAMLNPDSLRQICRHYQDPKVGGVAGEKKILEKNDSAVGSAEGLYWKYESWHKKIDARFYTVVGAAGELFSIRTRLFKPLHNPVILDDFVISMQTCLQGYRIAYEPGAFATEPASANLREEMKRKVRIAAGAYQAIGLLLQCFNFIRHPFLSFQYFSRRILRWIFCPLMLIILLVSSVIAFVHHASWMNIVFLSGQIIFYLAASAGWIIVRSGKKAGIFTIPFYFVFMNYCMIRGFIRFITKKQSVLWEKSAREVIG